MKMHLFDKVLSPHLTEKSTNLSEQNKIIFKVNVTKINIINKKSRVKATNRGTKKIAGYKKAIVTIKKGQNIDLTAGI